MTKWLTRSMPILADLSGIGLFLLYQSWLSHQFQQQTVLNSLIIGLFFILFCLAVHGLKKLPPNLPITPNSQRVWAGLGVIFSLFISIVTAYTVGFLDSTIHLNRQVLDEPSVTLYLLITPASWFGLALIYMLVLSSPTESSVPLNSYRYPLVTFLGLSGVNLMAGVTTAFWQAIWARLNPAGSFFIPLFLLSLLLYLPPRLVSLLKQGHWESLISFLLWLAFLTSQIK